LIICARARVCVLMRDTRYWFEGRREQGAKGMRDDSTARSFEAWLAATGSAPHGTRVWQCHANYYVKALAGCGGPRSGCAVEGNAVGHRELALARAALAEAFSVVLITEWLGSEGQGALLATALCFAWPRPFMAVPRGSAAGTHRAVPDFTPKRCARAPFVVVHF